MKTIRVSVCELSELFVEFADTNEPIESLHSFLADKLELCEWEVGNRIRSAMNRYPDWGKLLLDKGYVPPAHARVIPQYRRAMHILDRLK